MPRREVDPQRLSNAWKELSSLEKLPLKKKISLANKTILTAFSLSEKPSISWSGGKDSTVLLHLVLKVMPKIPVIFVDLDCLFPESREYVKYLSKKWKLNLHIVKSTEYTFDSLTRKYGFPIFSKNIASNVERAVRSGNIRSQLTPFEKFLAQKKAKISCKCSQYLLEKPCKSKEKELSCDLKFVGLRALESRARVRLWADYGDLYSVQDYFGRNKKIIKCNPISIWSEDDIWDYFKLNGIPVCDIYKKGYKRNGCWTCAMAIRNGQLNRLKHYNSSLYEQLLNNSAMGKEIKRLHSLMLKTDNYKKYIVFPT